MDDENSEISKHIDDSEDNEDESTKEKFERISFLYLLQKNFKSNILRYSERKVLSTLFTVNYRYQSVFCV